MPVESEKPAIRPAYEAPTRTVPSPSRWSGELGLELNAMFHGSGWVAGSMRCATRVWVRIVVMSLLHTFRKSHQVLHASWWNKKSNAVPELMPLAAYVATAAQSTAAFSVALRAEYASNRAAKVLAICAILTLS